MDEIRDPRGRRSASLVRHLSARKGLVSLAAFLLLLGIGAWWWIGSSLAQEGVGVDERVEVSFSGLRLNRATQTFDTVATVRNVSGGPISEPLSLVIATITPTSVTLANAYETNAAGLPYVRLPKPDAALAPGEAVTAVLRFANPARVAFTFDHYVVAIDPDANTPPLADAGPGQTVLVGDTVVLDGSASSDRDGDSLTFSWALVTLPEGSLAVLDDPQCVTPSFVVDRPGTYVAELIVHDGEADSAPARVTITTANSAPIAVAGPDQTVFVGDVVTLDGSTSFDVDGDALTYRWTLIQTPVGSSAALTGASTATPSFTADRAGSYQARLVVSDGTLDSAPAVVTVSTENSRPVAEAGPDQIVLAGDTVQLDGAGSSDADGDPLTHAWSITSAPDGSQAVLSDPTATRPTLVPDLAGDYLVQLIVDDGDLRSLPDTVRITANAPPPDNNPPRIVSAPITTATVGVPYAYAVQAVDPDGDPLTYHLAMAPAGMSIGASTGLINWLPSEDGAVQIWAQVLDGRGGQDTQQFAITVAPAGEPLPPDPATVAPPIDTGVATTTFAATEFIYTGPGAIQSGVAPGTIEAKRAAVLRGRVLDRDGQPLSAVTLSMRGHPEFGQTLSRADGMFDMVVNGGGHLTIDYVKAGCPPAQRQLNVPWQDFALAPDVALIPLDDRVTPVAMGASSFQVARGNAVADTDGARQATLLFPTLLPTARR